MAVSLTTPYGVFESPVVVNAEADCRHIDFNFD